MADWKFELTDKIGTTLSELNTARNRTIHKRRNGIPEVSFRISHDDDDATVFLGEFDSGVPRLLVYRDNELVFSGLHVGTDEQAQDTSFITPRFFGAFTLLTERFTAVLDEHNQDDAGTIATDLITTANAENDTGIVIGSIEVTKTRDRTYENKQVAEAIVQLTNVLDGFDFEVVPLASGTSIGTFNVFARQGDDKPEALFEYGENTVSNVRSVSRKLTNPINKVRVVGSEGFVGNASDAASIAKYGLYMQVIDETDVIEISTLNAKAQEALRPNPIKKVTFIPEPGLSSTPQPLEDYDIGDTVRLNAKRGGLVISSAPRVNSIKILIDASGNEFKHELEIEESDE